MTLLAISLATAALFQTPAPISDPNEATFLAAIAPLSLLPTLFVQTNGYITFHGKSVPLVTNLSWNSFATTTAGTIVPIGAAGSTPTYQVDIETWVNSVLVKRIVADGTTMWCYDLTAHTYSATSYGGPSVSRIPTGNSNTPLYLPTLIADLNYAVVGNDAYLVKLLRQTYNPPLDSNSNPIFLSWMPAVLSEGLAINAPVTDPVNSFKQYLPLLADNFYMYDGSPKRSIVFEVIPGSGPTSSPVLRTIFVNQVEMLGGFPRLTSLTITPQNTPTTPIVFDTSLFVPYRGAQIQGWRSIVAPKAVKV